MNTYTPARTNLVATLFDTLTETLLPLLNPNDPPTLSDPGIEDLVTHLSATLTAALRATRSTPAAGPAHPAAPRPAAPRATTTRATTAQVGPAAGTVKPGSLRARLIDYLAAHPGQAFTVTELTHATDATSGGAVGAALNTMATHGEAIQTTDSPKRYTTPAGPTIPAPTAHHAEDDPGEEPEDTPVTDTPETNVTEQADAAPMSEPAAETATAEQPAVEHNPALDTDTAEQSEPNATTAPAESATRTRGKRR